jgi:predicted glycogen debranching enzyme
MSYIEFDKKELINLKYSISKELIRTNRAGSFASTTIINCNTRKYHGLLICPIEKFGAENHVLLSTLDETIIQHNAEFHLGIHKYPIEYSPKGHKYIRDYEAEPIPAITYRVGGVVLKKEMLLVEEEERILIKYTLLDAHSPTKIRFQPFLAFRNIHTLTKSNLDANTKFQKAKNGIKVKMYDGFPFLYMQTSKKSDYIHVPDWYYNIEYPHEQGKGYDYSEDLFVPGFFEMTIKKDEPIIFSAGTKEVTTSSLLKQFNSEMHKRIPRDSFMNCLENSAQQFITRKNQKTKIIAGFPWFGHWARDTLISLPGLSICRNEPELFIEVIDSMLSEVKKCFFRSEGNVSNPGKDSADAPLWFFWAFQKYQEYNPNFDVWKKYGKKLKEILHCYKLGTDHKIKMHDNYLIWAGTKEKAITWMDEYIDGKPVTPRAGFTIEMNALWYNAICYALELAKKAKDKNFISEWEDIPNLIKGSFKSTFWDKEKKYLADYVTYDYKNWQVRPNMIFAASLPFSPLEKEIKKSIIDIVKKELLTKRGLRTLSPQDAEYKGLYEGNELERSLAYHQGSARAWLIGAYAEAYLKLYKKSGVSHIQQLFDGFEESMKEHGIGSISEVFSGNPPHTPGGATSFALSVAEMIRVSQLINKYNN